MTQASRSWGMIMNDAFCEGRTMQGDAGDRDCSSELLLLVLVLR